jgi:hypothetical protein
LLGVGLKLKIVLKQKMGCGCCDEGQSRCILGQFAAF